ARRAAAGPGGGHPAARGGRAGRQDHRAGARQACRGGAYRRVPRAAPAGRTPLTLGDTSADRGAEGGEMSTNEGHRLDRAAAERLLADPTAAGTGQPRLAALLAAVAAPPARAALQPGEAAALAAFRAAHRDPAPQPRRLSMLKTSLAKLLTVKLGVICAAVLGLGGVAVAR